MGLEQITAADRLAVLREVTAGPADPAFDRLTRLGSRLLGVPMSLVTLVGDEAQVFAGATGMAGSTGTPLSHSLCQYVVASGAPLLIEDARRVPWLRDNGAVTELGVIAYAGLPLYRRSQPLGSFCAIDVEPHPWGEADLEVLRDLTALAQEELDRRA